MNPDDPMASYYTGGYYSGIDNTTNDSLNVPDVVAPATNTAPSAASSSPFSLGDFLGNNLIGAASTAYGQTLQAQTQQAIGYQNANRNDAAIASAQATAQIQSQLIQAQLASSSAAQAQNKTYFMYALIALGLLFVWKQLSK